MSKLSFCFSSFGALKSHEDMIDRQERSTNQYMPSLYAWSEPQVSFDSSSISPDLQSHILERIEYQTLILFLSASSTKLWSCSSRSWEMENRDCTYIVVHSPCDILLYSNRWSACLLWYSISLCSRIHSHRIVCIKELAHTIHLQTTMATNPAIIITISQTPRTWTGADLPLQEWTAHLPPWRQLSSAQLNSFSRRMLRVWISKSQTCLIMKMKLWIRSPQKLVSENPGGWSRPYGRDHHLGLGSRPSCWESVGKHLHLRAASSCAKWQLQGWKILGI